MKLLFSSLYFWVATAILLGAIIVFSLFFAPPLLGKISSNKSEIQKLTTQIAENEQFLTTLKVLEEESDQLDVLYEKATLSLPKEPQPEILILQLDGLLKSLELDKVTITVPLTGTGTKVGAKAPTSQATKFTLSGAMSFEKAQELIVKLRGLSRWNKLTSVDLTRQGVITTVAIAGEAAAKPGAPKPFSGSKTFLADATRLFDSLKPYTTIPDVTTEGTFGRDDPFAN